MYMLYILHVIQIAILKSHYVLWKSLIIETP